MLNIERYKDKILEDDGIEQLDCILCDLMNGKCDDLDCKECRKKTREWLFKEYNPLKMTKFEYDLLDVCVSSPPYTPIDIFGSWKILAYMKERGYFKNVDSEMLLEDVFKNAEVEDDE